MLAPARSHSDSAAQTLMAQCSEDKPRAPRYRPHLGASSSSGAPGEAEVQVIPALAET